MRIGFVGTGTMGTPIAGCLIRAGHSLSVYDRRLEATAALCAQGAARTESAFAAARDNEVVFTSLPGPAEFEAAMLEPQTGILAGLQPGAAVYRPDHQCAEDRRPRRRSLPVARGRADRRAGQRPSAQHDRDGRRQRRRFRRYRPLFEAIAANVFHVGPSGAGATAKLVTQYLGYTNFIASIEGMLVAAKAGIDLDILARIVPVSAGQSRTFDNIAARRVPAHLCRRRHARHRRQGCGTRLPACPRRRRPGGTGRARVRYLPARPGAGLGPGGVPGCRPRARSDGRDRIAARDKAGGEA